MQNLPAALDFEAILASSRRLPFGLTDLEAFEAYFKLIRMHGLDLVVAGTTDDLAAMLYEGNLFLESMDLRAGFLLVNVDGGKGFFGKQKTRVATYTSDMNSREYFAGPVLGGLLRALVGINNLYRAAGILQGPAT